MLGCKYLSVHISESKELIEFYEQNLPQLKRCSLNYVPSHIMRAIAVYIDTTALFPGQWRKYATDMGITDNYVLNVSIIQVLKLIIKYYLPSL